MVAFLVVAASLVWSAEPAAACSCEDLSPAGRLAVSEAAFIGTLAGTGEGSTLQMVGYRFEVRRWLGGPFDSGEIWVDSDPEEDSCGFGNIGGGPVAVFLYRVDRERPTSGLCSVISAERAIAGLQPPGVDSGGGPATIAMVEPQNKPHLWLLDDEGNRVAFAESDPAASEREGLRDASVCPGGRTIAEQWLEPTDPGTLVIRDLATMDVEATVPLPGVGQALEFRCTSGDPVEVMTRTLEGDTLATHRLGVEGVMGEPVTVEVPDTSQGRDPAASGNTAVRWTLTRVQTTDLATGVTTDRYETAPQPEGEVQRQAIHGVAVNPSGTKLALLESFALRGSASSLVLIDLEADTVVMVRSPEDGWGQISWLDDRWISLIGRARISVVDSTNLEAEPRIQQGASHGWPALADDRLFVFQQGGLDAIDFNSGARVNLTTGIDHQPYGLQVLALDEPLTITGEFVERVDPEGATVESIGWAPTAEPSEPAESSEPAEFPSEDASSNDGDEENAIPADDSEAGPVSADGGGAAPLLVGVAGLGLAALAGVMFARRRG